MYDAARDTLTPCDRIIESGDGDAGLPARVDRVTDDAIRIRVFNCTEVKFPLTRWVLGAIGQPDLVGTIRCELAAYEIIMHGHASRLSVAASFLAKHAPPLAF